MIISLKSSLTTFKSITFHEGLNILLSDTTDISSQKQTRNSAGKSSLIEIVHFIYGADCDKESLLRQPPLIDHSFTATIKVSKQIMKVSRSGSDSSKIYIDEGAGDIPRYFVKTEKNSERLFVSNSNWRVYLGFKLFHLPLDAAGTIHSESYTPTFRALFSYYARRVSSGAFLSPERQAERQQRWDWQMNLSYLLGLDWHVPFEINKIRMLEKQIEELKKAVKAGALNAIIGTVAELRPQVTVAEAEVAKLRERISKFEILDSYRQHSQQAAHLKIEIQRLTRQNVSLNENLEHLLASVASEEPALHIDIENLYNAAGVELPGMALRRLDDVAVFYRSIIENRRTHLRGEIQEVQDHIAGNNAVAQALDRERSEILQMMEGKGAFDDFTAMQTQLSEAVVRATMLRERFIAAEKLEGETTRLDIERARLKQLLQADHGRCHETLDRAILIVHDVITRLYDDRRGELIVEATDNGPEFRISIEGDRGGGIAKMEIFCFDIALQKVTAAHFATPGFLIHDSHLFDGVDERQIATALGIGAETSQELGQQYIVTMNSDIFDRLPKREEDPLARAVLETRLSDTTDSGGLFGFQFS